MAALAVIGDPCMAAAGMPMSIVVQTSIGWTVSSISMSSWGSTQSVK